MARAPQHDILFEPVRLGPKVLRNRFWQTPHSIAAGSDHPGFQAAYRGVKAEGGWGAVFVEATAVSVDADVDPLTIVRLWDEGDVRNLRLTTDAIHEHGSLAGLELFYGGAPVNSGEARHPYLGPTQTITDAKYLSSIAEMGRDDVADVQQLYVAAACRARDAGFDLVTVGVNHAIGVIARSPSRSGSRRSASSACTASATATPRASSPRPSTPGTGWPGRSTAPTPAGPCRTSVSAGCSTAPRPTTSSAARPSPTTGPFL
jgi:hypothetical protein